MKRRPLLALSAAGALVLLLVAAQVSGVAPQRLLAGATAGGSPATTGAHTSACGIGDVPCDLGPQGRPPMPYCRWLEGQGIQAQGSIPCELTSGCYCPPPCTGLCPVGRTGTPTG